MVQAAQPSLDSLFAYTSEEALRAKFGSDVSTVAILENEAGDVDYTALYANTPKEVVFEFPSRLRVRQAGSPWRSGAGVGIGTTLAELEKLNGGPLELSPSPEGIQARVRAEGGLQGHSLYLGVGDDLYPKLSGEVQSDSAEARALGLAVRDFFLYR